MEKTITRPTFRHEWKHLITWEDMLTLRMRLKAVAKADIHTVDGRYHIRSLYFDNYADRVLREKLDSVSVREKYRIRYYNGDPLVMFLEKKCKQGGLGYKLQTRLSISQAKAILNGDIGWMKDAHDGLLTQFYSALCSQGLRPKTIVDYMREPYTYQPGNVRVTLDYDIRTGLSCVDFLNPDCVMIPAGDEIVLEVKWDQFLPSVIRSAVQLDSARTTAFSKYQACRRFG